MRWKFGSDIVDEYRCCGCIHVKTATLFIGVFIVTMQLMLLSTLVVMVSNEQKIANSELWKPADLLIGTTTFATPSSSPATSYWFKNKGRTVNTPEDLFGGFLFFGSCVIITLMLIYGTIKNKPGYLTPFMGLQVFDFCISSLNLITYFSCGDDLKKWITKQDKFPYKDKLVAMQTDMLMLLFVLVSVMSLCLKVYMMGIVWSCYKFMNSQLHGGSGVRRFSNDCDVESTVTDVVEPRNAEVSQIVLPPKYEDINSFPIVIPLRDSSTPPPPPYSAANNCN